jgi:SAM-dependent methyltransferase
MGYDNLDMFINGLLSDQSIPEATMEREPGMVFYQKTPARILFELAAVAELKPGDVFFDIGSGLGQAAILVNLISGATARGIEYEPAYCNYAKACASRLSLSNVEFINAGAHQGDYSQGTVFYLYTPFEGLLLQDMLEILQKEAQKRTIRIFTYGPCSSHVARQGWLTCVNGNGDNAYKLYEFIPWQIPGIPHSD